MNLELVQRAFPQAIDAGEAYRREVGKIDLGLPRPVKVGVVVTSCSCCNQCEPGNPVAVIPDVGVEEVIAALNDLDGYFDWNAYPIEP